MADETKNDAATVTGTGSTQSVSPAKVAQTAQATGVAAPAPAAAPVTEKAAEPAPEAPKGLEAKDEYGNALGFTLDVGEASGQGEGVAALASRVHGWTPFMVDGADFPYTEQNALVLLNRFPYIAKQVEGYGA
jgi:hypothetical protein